MIGKRTQSALANPCQRARVLAALLLASIAWGATAEFSHQHGFKSTVSLRGSVLSQAPVPNVAEQPSARWLELGETQSPSSRSTTGADCLICQLHQNLATTLFNSPPRVASADIRVLCGPAPVVFQLSEFALNQQGRAPPSIL